MSSNFDTQQTTEPFDPWTTVAVCVLVFFGSFVFALLLLGVAGYRPHMPESAAEAMRDPEMIEFSVNVMLVQACVGAAVLYGLVQLRLPDRFADYLGLRLPDTMDFLKWLGIAGLYVVGGSVVVGALQDASGSAPSEQLLNSVGLSASLVFAVVIAAPVFEEIMFRGVLLSALRRTSLGFYGAILTTSAVWAVLHADSDVFTLIFIFGLGVIFAFARIRTGSLFVPIALHGLNNTIALLVR